MLLRICIKRAVGKFFGVQIPLRCHTSKTKGTISKIVPFVYLKSPTISTMYQGDRSIVEGENALFY